MITLAVMATIVAAMLFLMGFFAALVKEGMANCRQRATVTSIPGAGYLLGRERGAAVWSAPAVCKVVRIAGPEHWRRIALRVKERSTQPRLKLV